MELEDYMNLYKKKLEPDLFELFDSMKPLFMEIIENLKSTTVELDSVQFTTKKNWERYWIAVDDVYFAFKFKTQCKYLKNLDLGDTQHAYHFYHNAPDGGVFGRIQSILGGTHGVGKVYGDKSHSLLYIFIYGYPELFEPLVDRICNEGKILVDEYMKSNEFKKKLNSAKKLRIHQASEKAEAKRRQSSVNKIVKVLTSYASYDFANEHSDEFILQLSKLKGVDLDIIRDLIDRIRETQANDSVILDAIKLARIKGMIDS